MRNCAILLTIIVILILFFAGCTQSSRNGPVGTAVPDTTPPADEPTTPVSFKDIKDSEHLFLLQVPVEWNVKTYRLNILYNPEGYAYQTDLVDDNVFYIQTFTAFPGQEQVYRDQFRKWSPSPTETTVTINDIMYDRFESTPDNKTFVAYVAHKISANERGYASVIVFVADTGNQFEKENFEEIVASFRYLTGSDARVIPGEEIARTNPPFKPSDGCGVCGG